MELRELRPALLPISKSSNIMSREYEEEGPVDPRKRDILFGRGGMTKHHVGNAWFRGLMKENRILYAESPKHHKLRLVEEIVDYILQQNCRFLNRRKESGGAMLWYPVSYKRSVEKTSQAFRDAHRYETKLEKEMEAPHLSNTNPHTMQQLLIRHSMGEIFQAPAAKHSFPGTVILLPPPTEWGDETVPTPKVTTMKPSPPIIKKCDEVEGKDTTAAAVRASLEQSVAQNMLALFEVPRNKGRGTFDSVAVTPVAQELSNKPILVERRDEPQLEAKQSPALRNFLVAQQRAVLEAFLSRHAEPQGDDQFADADEDEF
mmetsp:Transcript_11153/g.18494  ORF Transcript_11153/g.18494 Transcript_11153/m.18494 type:complete len:317 (+) Transcript_11153:22-972(+)|eukprot:CAMPEP_0119010632 /NCGR_PEP_ID=MMETSP1176-20130426/5145_1 /TAXON_ID=265551 /ORGANISM="Synedropsis recta cf, Strain CCMP1620" /LENGTH=316 /DNA_ID=CAMNT_0006963331 /DNA_START=1 /DNA_END=951 /DNA_ORIENTATION=-